MKLPTLLLLIPIAPILLCAAPVEWPEVSNETKPWSRWWWQGSAVNTADLSSSLEAYSKAGLGGMEITPIYGVHGYEDEFIDYLSPKWMEMLDHSLAEAKRLGLGIDMATGTGWPFGGPSVTSEDACKYFAHKTYTLNEGESLSEPIFFQQEKIVRSVTNQIYQTTLGTPSDGEQDRSTGKNPTLLQESRALEITDLVEPIAANENLQQLALDQIRFPKPLPLQTLVAYSNFGYYIDLTKKIADDGMLDWKAPTGQWTLYAIFMGEHGKMVERAAPGGEGNVIDHFSAKAIRNYLDRFDDAFAGHDLSYLRSFFNDSYEVDDSRGIATWTPDFLEEFQKRRGYDLRAHLPALFADSDPQSNALILADYRETISDLLLDTFTSKWANWAHGKNAVVRNQAHGSPANILDLYAASDIPETESLEYLRLKWASSAGHVAGKKLISAETATWLNEHFVSTLSDVRKTVDHFFLNGVNHIVYHGTNYAPEKEDWPGWLFYASTHFNPRNSWWTDFDILNAYVTRTQSFLQSGQPDTDILLYFPAYADYAKKGEELLKHYGEGNQKIEGSNFQEITNSLNERGYTHDFVSDRQLLKTTFDGNRIRTQGGNYKVIVVPETNYINYSTFEKLIELAVSGATVVFHKLPPLNVSGFANQETEAQRYAKRIESFHFRNTSVPGTNIIRSATGAILIGQDLEATLELVSVNRERLIDQGLQFTRRRNKDGLLYFISNTETTDFKGWIKLNAQAKHTAIYDPMTGKLGRGTSRKTSDGHLEIYAEIPSSEALIVTTSNSKYTGSSFAFYSEKSEPISISNNWEIKFLQGGPTLPSPRKTDTLESWTKFPGHEHETFSGTASYTTTFKKPAKKADAWKLDLGEVHQSAKVFLNGEQIGALIGPDFQLTFDHELLEAINTLEIRVSNRMTNRIADLDKRDVLWKKHYNVNFPARRSENRDEKGLFTAKSWTPDPSGLIGPVTLTRLKEGQPKK